MDINPQGFVDLGAGNTAEVTFNAQAPWGVLLLVKSGKNVMTYTMLNDAQASELGSILMGAALQAGRARQVAEGWRS